MKFLSLFSGVGGFDLGLERAGMECVGQVEIDPQCRRVLEAHWPDVWRGEDVRSVGLGRAADHVGGEPHDASADPTDALARLARIDLICGGFPCQDLSVAGKRAGLDGARSGLWFEFQRIVSELRPRYVLVENVPGLLSSNGGRDFAIVLNGLGELGYSVSWAVLDAQHFGVAQRRRRVFIVAGPDPGRTEAVLALAEGCAGHPAPGRAQGQDLAATVRSCSSSAGVNPPGRGGEDDSNLIVAKSLPNASHRDDSDTYVPEPSYAPAAWNAKGVSLLEGQDTFVVRTAQTGANGHGVSDVAHTLDGAQGQAVAFAENQRGELFLTAVTNSLAQAGGKPGQGYAAAMVGASVRRLTATECERLQGFPDGWTDVGGMADGPRYRMLGNAVCVPVAEWIGRRIMAAEGA